MDVPRPDPPSATSAEEDLALAQEVDAFRERFFARAWLRGAGLVGSVAALTGFVCAVSLASPVGATAVLVAVGLLLALREASPSVRWSLFAAPLALFCGIAWARALDHEIIFSNFGCGMMDELAIIALPGFAVMASAAASTAVLAMTKWAKGWIPHLARFVAVSSGALALGLSPFVIHASVARPAAERYVASVPTVGAIIPDFSDGSTCGSHEADEWNGNCRTDTTVAGFTFVKHCNPGRCNLALANAKEGGADLSFSRVEPIIVRHDVAASLVLLSSMDDRIVAAFSTVNGRPVDVRPSQIRVGPPLSVVGFSCLAALLAAAGASWCYARRRKAQRWLDAVEGVVDEHGFLSVASDVHLGLLRLEHVRPGKVLVLSRRTGEAYRDAGRADVLPTSHEEVRESLRCFEARVVATLALVTPLSLVPAIVAASLGLVF